jgi:cytochrome c oxidase assembly protein subunit 11
MTGAPEKKRLRRTALVAGAVVAGMTGMAFAAVPLYDAFCKVTGYGGTTQEASVAPDQILDQRIHIRFDANTSPDLPVEFAPRQNEQSLRIGETGLAFYRVRKPLTPLSLRALPTTSRRISPANTLPSWNASASPIG